MKIGFKMLFWVLSVALMLLAFVLFFGGALSGVLMLAAAIIVNPLFIQGIQLKKGMTALLVLGLFIASIAVLPGVDRAQEDNVAAGIFENVSAIQPLDATNGTTQSSKETMLKESSIEHAQEIVVTPETTATPNPTATPTSTPAQQPTPTKTPVPTPTPTPTSTPTKTPVPVPTPAPTKMPKPTATPAPTAEVSRSRAAGIVIVDYSKSVSRGARAFIEIQGAPNTEYTCDVEYKSGSSSADGLGTKTSNGDGIVRWSWKVGSRTSLDYIPTIYISGGGDSINVDFEVTK